MDAPHYGGPGIMAYNFLNYSPGFLRNPSYKKIIKLRQAAGTIDGDDIVTIVQIHIGLRKFACRADLASLWSGPLFSSALEQTRCHLLSLPKPARVLLHRVRSGMSLTF